MYSRPASDIDVDTLTVQWNIGLKRWQVRTTTTTQPARSRDARRGDNNEDDYDTETAVVSDSEHSAPSGTGQHSESIARSLFPAHLPRGGSAGTRVRCRVGGTESESPRISASRSTRTISISSSSNNSSSSRCGSISPASAEPILSAFRYHIDTAHPRRGHYANVDLVRATAARAKRCRYCKRRRAESPHASVTVTTSSLMRHITAAFFDIQPRHLPRSRKQRHAPTAQFPQYGVSAKASLLNATCLNCVEKLCLFVCLVFNGTFSTAILCHRRMKYILCRARGNT